MNKEMLLNIKNKIISNYIHTIISIFIIHNLILRNLVIGGLLYHIVMIVLIILNVSILLQYKDKIEYSGTKTIIFCLIWLISKDFYGIIFTLSTTLTLLSTDFIKNTATKVVVIFITFFILVFSIPYAFLIEFSKNKDDIWEHYRCEHNSELYIYFNNNVDKFYYAVDKKYKFLNKNDIIYMSYKWRIDISKKWYNEYLDDHECVWVDDLNKLWIGDFDESEEDS